MNTTQDYITIESHARAPELKVKGSRFIADIFPVADKSEIEAALEGLRKEFYDASHHCYAYRLGAGAELIRAADDGEPSGTAGKPILLALSVAQLTDALLVVTRYFGGTLLGTGGLARAYMEAAQAAIRLAPSKRVLAMAEFRCELAYDDLSTLQRLLPKFEALITQSKYDERVHLTITTRANQADLLKAALIEALNGRVNIQSTEDK